jgi:cytochrome c-type biogenesis protein CcmH
MTVFWLVAALFLLGAALIMLPALWNPRGPWQAAPAATGANVAVHRDQLREAEADLAAGLITPERFEQARSEIQARVLEDVAADEAAAAATALAPARRTAVAVGLFVVIGSVATYLALGDPPSAAPQLAAVPPAQAGSPGNGEARHSVTPDQIQKMVDTLAERLRADPANTEGWLMLGRSYVALGRYRDAATALRRAADLMPGNANLMADLADVVGMAQGKRLAGEPARLVQQVLDIDPRHVKALALAGTVAFQARDYPAARGYWERLVGVLPPDSPMQRGVRNNIAEAVALERGEPLPTQVPTGVVAAGAAPAAAGSAAATSTSTAASISGRVTLAPSLASRLAEGDTLFIFARAAQGPRMPLAIVRRGAVLPADFMLDDSMAMAPSLKLSAFAQVVVGARISRSGNATPQPGDLIGQSGPVAPGVQGVAITIDSVQP